MAGVDGGYDAGAAAIVLYEAAVDDESRPFPRRPIFTAWFDTGKQGKEWPGNFEIVSKIVGFKKLDAWKAAKAVPRPDAGPWIRLHLRGERPLGDVTHLRFRYFVTGADTVAVGLVHAKEKKSARLVASKLKAGEWGETTLDFSEAGGALRRADEIHFELPAGGELMIDDVLLYEPGGSAR
jgi:hypothetical protein